VAIIIIKLVGKYMRTIGKRNIKLVEKTTLAVKKECEAKYQNATVEEVVARLPVSLWETWESADSEIRRIISDTFWKTI
jgi:hypothetical protein